MGHNLCRYAEEFPDAFGFPLATTTREPNEGELDGVHYKFATREVGGVHKKNPVDP
jgi:guanylate kinase